MDAAFDPPDSIRLQSGFWLLVLAACSGGGPEEPPLPTGPPVIPFAIVDAATGHTCGITTTGEAYCWGVNDEGRLGLGPSHPSAGGLALSPERVIGGLTYTTISAGLYHTCALAVGGAAYCWGQNGAGTLGIGAELNAVRDTPSAVLGGLVLRSLSASAAHSCAITMEGAGYCWGEGSAGQLGTGDRARTSEPRPVAGDILLESVTSEAGGDSELAQVSCGLTSAGAAYCWGGNQGGQLGDGEQGGGLVSSVPVAVVGGHVFTTISAAAEAACGVTTDGKLYCWGRGTSVPTLVPGGLDWLTITVGPTHQCGITSGHDGYCWGLDTHGQLGVGTLNGDPVPEPTIVAGGHSWAHLSAGRYHTCGITTAGETYCWGLGEQGQLGIGELPVHAGDFRRGRPVLVAVPQ